MLQLLLLLLVVVAEADGDGDVGFVVAIGVVFLVAADAVVVATDIAVIVG